MAGRYWKREIRGEGKEDVSILARLNGRALRVSIFSIAGKYYGFNPRPA